MYRYLGDRFTDPILKGQECTAVRNETTGKCIRGRNGNMLVQFCATGHKVNVVARLLRKIK